jgi:hypothetical protein
MPRNARQGMLQPPIVDDVARLIASFRASGVHTSVAAKLDVLMDLEQIHHPRVVEFMLQILADRLEHRDVRIHVLRRVRNGMLTPDQRPAVAVAIVRVLQEDTQTDLRLQAALALGEFAEVPGVVAALGAVAGETEESFDLRYAAFTSLDRAGPTPEYLAVLSQLSDDEMLGHSARSVLLAWAPRGAQPLTEGNQH